MSDDDFALVRRVFEDALDQPEGERVAWVRAECGENAAALAQVLEMLGHEPDEGFLDSPIGSSIGQLLEESDLSGKSIGKFKIVRPIGRGGMGSVYLAEQEAPKRLVALKILEGLPSARARRRFEYESELLASLSHPGIAQVFEAGSVPLSVQLPYFAMEYVEEGQPVLDYARLKELTLEARLELFLQFADAVQHGHTKGILHRDLKPANMLVSKEGRAKVIDFGIARAVGTDEGHTQLTSTGEITGTLAYMAPERLLGDESAGDAGSDVYSLGVVLYELLTDAKAISLSGLSLPEAIRKVADFRPQAPREKRRDLPRDLNWIVLRAMESEPERRYPTVAAFADDVRAYQRGEPVSAGPPTALYRLQKFVQRNRTGVLVALFFAVVLAVAGGRVAASRSAQRRAEARTRSQAVQMLRIRDTAVLEDLRREAEELFPAVPELLSRMEAWLRRADEVAQGLAETEAVLVELALARGERSSEADGDLVTGWLRESLEEHAQELREFLAPEGLVADVRSRLDLAARVAELSTEGPEARQAWALALDEIGDPDGIYGFPWEAQLGLLPLEPDPESGLWEFAHLLSGDPVTERDARGHWKLEPRHGLVLVLLPGGPTRIGAVRPSAGNPIGAPHVDPHAFASEGPVLNMTLGPFLLSKFEVTQVQWRRIGGDDLSQANHGALFPVESIDWHLSDRILARWEMEFPTSAQWEYAARAGTTSPWWTGSEPDDWDRVANVLRPSTVEVGSYLPNPFGLFDVSGNVAEWCLDQGDGSYQKDSFATDTTGVLVKGGSPAQRVFRGGHFASSTRTVVVLTRASWRHQTDATSRQQRIGLRPARPLDRPDALRD